MIAEWVAYVWEELSSTLRSAPCKLYFSQSWMLICELEFLHEDNKHTGSRFNITFTIIRRKWVIKEGINNDTIYLLKTIRANWLVYPWNFSAVLKPQSGRVSNRHQFNFICSWREKCRDNTEWQILNFCNCVLLW